MKRIVRSLIVAFFTFPSWGWGAPIILNNVSGIENLEWAVLAESQGLSRFEVEAELTAGGQFDGWRYATRTEVGVLLGAFWPGHYSGWAIDNHVADQFIDLFGNTWSQSSYPPSSVFTLDGAPPLWDYMAHSAFFYGTPGECFGTFYTCEGWVSVTYLAGVPVAGYLALESGLDPAGATYGLVADTKAQSYASLLVRTIPVPEPTTLALSGVGLFVLWMARRKTPIS